MILLLCALPLLCTASYWLYLQLSRVLLLRQWQRAQKAQLLSGLLQPLVSQRLDLALKRYTQHYSWADFLLNDVMANSIKKIALEELNRALPDLEGLIAEEINRRWRPFLGFTLLFGFAVGLFLAGLLALFL